MAGALGADADAGLDGGNSAGAPGPGGLGLRRLVARMRDGLGFYEGLRKEFGEVVGFRILHRRFVVTFGARAIREVMVEKEACFEKGPAVKKMLVLKNPTTVTADGEDHRQHAGPGAAVVQEVESGRLCARDGAGGRVGRWELEGRLDAGRGAGGAGVQRRGCPGGFLRQGLGSGRGIAGANDCRDALEHGVDPGSGRGLAGEAPAGEKSCEGGGVPSDGCGDRGSGEEGEWG